MSLISLMLLIRFLFLRVNSPFLVGALFVATLLLSALIVGSVDSFLGLIVFVIYIGGALVLFSYCFILTPLQDSAVPFSAWVLPLVRVTVGLPLTAHATVYEFYWIASLLLRVGVLLFVVIVCVVALIDFSEGAIRVL